MTRPILLLALLCSAVVTWAQTTTRTTSQVRVRVEVTPVRKDYVVGDEIRFRALLVNEGSSPVFVAKDFLQSGGYVSGFEIRVHRLTGKWRKEQCGDWAGDKFRLADRRIPEQILREDFIKLPADGILGFETDAYHSCPITTPGTFSVTAIYSAEDPGIKRLLTLSEIAPFVVQGKTESKPVTFRVHSRPAER